jgi:hypothetical protein
MLNRGCPRKVSSSSPAAFDLEIWNGVSSAQGCGDGYMSSKRELVSMPGRLQGMGHDVPCTVFAEKVSLPGTDVYEHDRPFISGAPRDLQNGLYKVKFDGQAMSVQRHNGAWVFTVPPGKTVARV